MRALIVLVAALVALAGVASAAAQGPTFRERASFSEVDADFCGTGKTVLIDGKLVVNGWIGETGGDPDQVIKLILNIHVTYTNPANGRAVVERWSQLETNEIVEGQESGPHTHEFSNTGLKAMLKLKNGGVLTRDAGSITFRVSFDENDDFVGLEVVSIHGPHPGFFEDLFCSTVTDALGL
ncbi:MAG TPA: hypothetical protein VK926_03045 [Gaiellaceae bacterium]|nr:hypothetical protein [Gaiellaceae bacterium]